MTTKTKNQVLMIASFVISLLVVYYRRPDSFYNSQFWAEEGSRFFSEAYHQGFKSLFHTCNGYFHLLPRFIACSCTFFHIPPEYIPTVFCYSWLLILMFILVYIWQRLPLPALQKFFIALTVTLIPIQSEIIMNLTNVQWMLALFPIIIFSSTDTLRNEKWFWIDVLILILCGLTGPNFIVLLPVFLVLIFYHRRKVTQEKKKNTLFVVAIVCSIIVACSLINYGNVDRSQGQFTLLNAGFVKHFYLQCAFLFLGEYAERTPFFIMAFASIVIIVSLFFLFRTILHKKDNPFGLICFLSACLFFVVTAIAYRYYPNNLSPFYYGVRNFYLPAVTFIWALIFILPEKRWSMFVLTFIMTLFSFETIHFVGRTRYQDLNWKKYAKQIPQVDTLTIPINPHGWFIHIENNKSKEN